MLTGGPVDNRALEGRARRAGVHLRRAAASRSRSSARSQADLCVGSSLDHTDFFVRLCDVSPDGRSINVCDGLQRFDPATIRRAADGTFRVTVAMWPVGHRFAAGHRLRIQVSSGAHPVYARNLGTGDAAVTATRMQAADQAVYHEPGRLSSVVLPHLRS